MALVAAFAAFSAVSNGLAETGPFAGLDGMWSGDGTISLIDGGEEGIRCRNQYLVTEGGANLQQALRCASDSFNFQVNAHVDVDARGAITGSWTEVTRNISGQVTGTADGGAIDARVEGAGGFSARISIVTAGDRQTVRIEPTGTDVTRVAVTLSKAR